MSLGQGKEFDALSATEWQPYYSFPDRGHVLGAMGLDKNQKNHRVVEKTCGGGGAGAVIGMEAMEEGCKCKRGMAATPGQQQAGLSIGN